MGADVMRKFRLVAVRTLRCRHEAEFVVGSPGALLCLGHLFLWQRWHECSLSSPSLLGKDLAQAVPTRIWSLRRAVAPAFVPVGAALGAETLAIGSAEGFQGQACNDVLPDRFLEVQDVPRTDEEGTLRRVWCRQGKPCNNVHGGKVLFIKLESNRLFYTFETSTALTLGAGLEGTVNPYSLVSVRELYTPFYPGYRGPLEGGEPFVELVFPIGANRLLHQSCYVKLHVAPQATLPHSTGADYIPRKALCQASHSQEMANLAPHIWVSERTFYPHSPARPGILGDSFKSAARELPLARR